MSFARKGPDLHDEIVPTGERIRYQVFIDSQWKALGFLTVNRRCATYDKQHILQTYVTICINSINITYLDEPFFI